MRIRVLSDCAELTLKVPQTIGNMEYNQKMTLPEAEYYLEKQILPQGMVMEKLTEIGIESHNWLILGCLETIRYEMETDIGLMALRSKPLLWSNRHELELEVTDFEQGKSRFSAIFR